MSFFSNFGVGDVTKYEWSGIIKQAVSTVENSLDKVLEIAPSNNGNNQGKMKRNKEIS